MKKSLSKTGFVYLLLLCAMGVTSDDFFNHDVFVSSNFLLGEQGKTWIQNDEEEYPLGNPDPLLFLDEVELDEKEKDEPQSYALTNIQRNYVDKFDHVHIYNRQNPNGTPCLPLYILLKNFRL